MIYLKIIAALTIGVILPYVIDYRKNHINDDSYFLLNKKILFRRACCDIFLAGVSYFAINQTNMPTEINWWSTIFIGANGCSVVENLVKNQKQGSEVEIIV